MAHRFSHWLIRQVGYEALLLADRRALHESTARTLEERVLTAAGLGPRLSEDELLDEVLAEGPRGRAAAAAAGELASHWVLSAHDGQEADAARRRAGLYFVLSSRRSEEECAYPVAVHEGRRAVELLTGDRTDAGVAGATVAKALRRAGAFEEAEGYFVRALAIATRFADSRSQAICLHGLGGVRAARGDYDAAERHFSAASEAARAVGDRALQALCLRGIGAVREERGGYEDAERIVLKALALSQEAGDLRAQAGCLHGLGGAAESQGAYARADRLFVDALEIAGAIADRRLRAGCLEGRGWVREAVGELVEAERLFSDARAIANEIGERRLHGYCLQGLALVRADRGDFDAAERLYEEAYRSGRELGDRRLQALCRAGLATAESDAGRRPEAEEAFAESLAALETMGLLELLAETLARRAEFRFAAGDEAAARRDAERIAAFAPEIRRAPSMCAVRRALGLVRGDEAALAESLALARQFGRPVDECRALLALSHASARAGDRPRSAAAATEAAELARRHGLAGLRLRAERLHENQGH